MKRFSAILLSVVMLLAAVPMTSRAAAAKPTIEPVSINGYMLAVQGAGWASNSPVTFTLVLGGVTYGIEVRATVSGALEVGAKSVDFCHGSRFWARDMAGHMATGPVGDPYCPANAHTSPLLVLQGKGIKPRVTKIYDTGHGETTTVRLGDEVYLWERGKASPRFMPAAPRTYFSLIGYGAFPAECAPGLGCRPGFYWRWIAMKPGNTSIVLRPWCGAGPCPQDYLLALPIRILARNMSL